MINEKYFSNIDFNEFGYTNPVYENMTSNEKLKIKSTMSAESIFEAKAFLISKTQDLDALYNFYQERFDPFDLISVSPYDRYYICAKYHHLLMQLKTNNTIQGGHKQQLYAQEEYENSYQSNQKLINLLINIMSIVFHIKDAKIGFIDSLLSKKEQVLALQHSIKNITRYLKNESNSNHEAKKLLAKFNELEINHSEILELLQINHLNYLSHDLSQYKIFEQVLLAPLKLKKYIDMNKYNSKNNNFESLKNHLKNFGLWNDEENEKIESMQYNTSQFFKIQKNQVKQYCVTIFWELFNINIFDTKRIYSFFYSNAITNTTKFLSSFYNHMPTKNVDEYLVVEEFLPYFHEDFKDIFYEVAPTNTPEKEIINYLILRLYYFYN